MIYKWGSRSYSVDAQLVGETVERLTQRNGGVCPPGALVDEARPDDSPLHPMFEWDDEHAAESWRRQQARLVINNIRVVIEESESQPPAFHHVKVVDSEGQVREGYADTFTVVSNNDMHRQVLAEAKAQLRGFRRRYESLSELAPVWRVLDPILEAEEVPA